MQQQQQQPTRNHVFNTVFCPDCRNHTPDIIEDFRNGDLICNHCGLILGDRIVDTHSEWRTFSNDSHSSGSDPNRVGGAANPLLNDSGLSTMIGRTDSNGNQIGSGNLHRYQTNSSLNSSDRNLLNAFREVNRMAERMNIPQAIRDRACELYKQVEERESMRGRSTDGVIAASLYIALRSAGVPRTFKEICALTTVPKRDVGRAYKFIIRVLGTRLQTIEAGNYMARFCSSLNLPKQLVRVCRAVAETSSELGIVMSRSPISVAAAVIYMVSQLSSERRSQKEIAEASGVAEVTIRDVYKVLRCESSKLLPPFFQPVIPIDKLPTC
eukprot:gnl/Trimastix_PCT/1782.p1 GENE.gnl/Trimastix_PCT/1782~~gnl/Trimastix_PCT/1782.p1  ORF type:complete len:326 (-),score=73.67 gnl/Trimastix_PCT/1782:112-1089(-)